MRKQWIGLVAVLFLVGAIFAGCGSLAPTETSAKPPTASPRPGVTPSVATVSGTIADVDVGRFIVVVETPSGARLVLHVYTSATNAYAKATITVNGAVTTLAGIRDRVGSRVIARYDPANNVAYSVEVT